MGATQGEEGAFVRVGVGGSQCGNTELMWGVILSLTQESIHMGAVCDGQRYLPEPSK